jgi:hypothetical protein
MSTEATNSLLAATPRGINKVVEIPPVAAKVPQPRRPPILSALLVVARCSPTFFTIAAGDAHKFRPPDIAGVNA